MPGLVGLSPPGAAGRGGRGAPALLRRDDPGPRRPDPLGGDRPRPAADLARADAARPPVRPPDRPAPGAPARRLARAPGPRSSPPRRAGAAPSGPVAPAAASARSRSPGSSARASARPESPPTPRTSGPRFVDLDPARGLSSTAARLDRLIRSILADPRALEPEPARPGRRPSGPPPGPGRPAEPGRRGRRAALGLARGRRSAREIARSDEVRRGVRLDDRLACPRAESTVFQGRADFLYRDPTGDSDPGHPERPGGARSRASGSGCSSRPGRPSGSGSGPVRQAWRVRLGTGRRARASRAASTAADRSSEAVRDGASARSARASLSGPCRSRPSVVGPSVGRGGRRRSAWLRA